MPNPLTFAVPKGRILDEALPLMARAGVVPDAEFHDKKSRALSFACENSDMRIIRVRAFDVATFVAHGAAQAGIVGSDVVEEFAYPGPLRAGRSRHRPLPPVGRRARRAADRRRGASHLRVASKYPNLTRRHFERQGIQAEVVKLNGAMELAPGLGLASRIVDLVSTGKTLKDNGLVETSIDPADLRPPDRQPRRAQDRRAASARWSRRFARSPRGRSRLMLRLNTRDPGFAQAFQRLVNDRRESDDDVARDVR